MRAFIAIELDEAVRSRLADAQERLRPSGARVKWVDAGNIHLTVKFLGEIEEGRTAEVQAAMAQAAAGKSPFPVTVSGLGAFPPRGSPRVVWAGIHEEGGVLAALQADLERALEAAGFPREKRRFHPHATLGRVKDRKAIRLRKLIEEGHEAEFGEQHVRELVLFRSELRPGGARYSVVGRQNIGAG